jgi:hypothetical protein
LPVNFQPLEEFGRPRDKEEPPGRLPTETKPKM